MKGVSHLKLEHQLRQRQRSLGVEQPAPACTLHFVVRYDGRELPGRERAPKPVEHASRRMSAGRVQAVHGDGVRGAVQRDPAVNFVHGESGERARGDGRVADDLVRLEVDRLLQHRLSQVDAQHHHCSTPSLHLPQRADSQPDHVARICYVRREATRERSFDQLLERGGGRVAGAGGHVGGGGGGSTLCPPE